MELDIFTEIEDNLNIEIPNCLKLMLKANGYENRALLANINDATITEIEKFGRETLPELIKADRYEEYYGPLFKDNVLVYTIVSGHRKLISMIADYCKKSISSNSGNSVKSFTMRKSSSASKTVEPLIEATDQTKDDCHIKNTLLAWIKKSYKDRHQKTLEIDTLQVRIKMADANAETCAYVKCCFCDISICLRKFASKETRNPRWVYANFHRHINLHIEMKVAQKNALKERTTVLDYFKPVGSEPSRETAKIKILQNIVVNKSNEEDAPGCSKQLISPSNVNFKSNSEITEKGKWKQDKYQRLERRKRARESVIEGQPLISNYCVIVDEIAK